MKNSYFLNFSSELKNYSGHFALKSYRAIFKNKGVIIFGVFVYEMSKFSQNSKLGYLTVYNNIKESR
jgi:hypothetical protein